MTEWLIKDCGALLGDKPEAAALNPLDAYTVGIETLMELCQTSDDETRFESARELLERTAVPPNVEWDFEPVDDE